MKIFGKEQRGKWWLAAPNYDPLQKHGGRKSNKEVSFLRILERSEWEIIVKMKIVTRFARKEKMRLFQTISNHCVDVLITVIIIQHEKSLMSSKENMLHNKVIWMDESNFALSVINGNQ